MSSGSFRRGPRSQISVLERPLRRLGLLQGDEHLLEWKQGRLQSMRVDGADQAVPEPALVSKTGLHGMASCSYSRRMFFLWTPKLTFGAWLELLWRLEYVEPRSLCAVYTVLRADRSEQLMAFRWRSDEIEDHDVLKGFATRVLEQQVRRFPEVVPDWRDWISHRRAALEDAGVIDRELAFLKAGAGGEGKE